MYIGILAFALVLLLFLGAGQASAGDVSGDISGDDVVWASGGTYNVTGDLYITGNLTIEDNVTVAFNGTYGVVVYGSLTIEGTADNPASFIYGTSYWDGIIYAPGSSGSVDHAYLYDVMYGLYFDNVSIPISNVVIDYTMCGLYYEFYGNEQDISLTLADITIINSECGLYMENYNGSLDVTLERVTTDGSDSIGYIMASTPSLTGTVDLMVMDCHFNDSWESLYLGADVIGTVQVTDSDFTGIWEDWAIYLESDPGDMVVNLYNVTFEDCGAALYIDNDNGSLDVTLEKVTTNHTYYVATLITTAFDGNGTLDLTIVDCQFNDSWEGVIYAQADMMGDVQITNTVFSLIDDTAMELYDLYGDMTLVIDGATFEDISGDAIYVEADVLADVQISNSTFTNILGYGVQLWVDEDDINFVLNNVTMDNVYGGACYVNALNGSMAVSLTEVHTNNMFWIGGWYAFNTYDTGVLTFSITDSTFNNSDNGIWFGADVISDITVTNTEFTGVWDSAVWYMNTGYAGISTGDLNMVFTNVLMDNVDMGIDPLVNGNITLTMESVTVNNTYMVGWFEAYNADNTAVINVMINDCVFSNAVYGLSFVADTIGDYQVTNTEFTNIMYYAISMTYDYADLIVPIDNVMSDNVGTFLDLTVTFGNIDLVITDSVLSGNNGTGMALIQVAVGSNSLDNGFISVTVSNSTFKNAGGGIWAWCEELVPVEMTATTFENIGGAAMRFDVRSGDVSFDFIDDEVTIIDVGIGLWVYANDGNFNLTLTGVHFITTDFGIFAEVSSLTDEDMSMINMEIIDSVLEGGAYGIFANSLNGGTILIDGSQFLNHTEAGYYYESVYGDVNVDIVNSVFDGSLAADYVLYTLQETDTEFDLIGRWGDWTATSNANGGSMTVDLPFTIVYDGASFNEVVMDDDGYLRFDGNRAIVPVGTTDLRYNNDQFYGYKIADDNSSVMFTWYAAESVSQGLSLAFQVVLYADGQIEIVYGHMESYASNVWYGLDVLGDDYDLRDVNGGLYKWETDDLSYLFTPVYISSGMGAQVTSDLGDMNVVVTNNTVTGYYQGGMVFGTFQGSMDFVGTGNEFRNIVGSLFGALAVANWNGSLDVTITDNTFERIWYTAINIYGESEVGVADTMDVSRNVFNKVTFGVYSEIYIEEEFYRTGNDTFTVTVDFLDNAMTDAVGMECRIYMELYNPVDWTVSVQQTMTGNTMVQEWYEGSWPFMTMMSYYGLRANLDIWDYGNSMSSLVVDQTITITDNVVEVPSGGTGIYAENYIYNPYGNTTRTAAIDVSDNTVNMFYGGSYGVYTEADMDIGSGTISDDVSMIVEDNQISDVYQDICGIEVYMGVNAQDDVEEATDANVMHYLSVTGNIVEGAYEGIYADIWYDQDNTIGTWSVSPTVHLDGNQLLNVSYGIYAGLYGGVWFGSDYWPLNDEVAVGDFVMDYLFTIDDNVVLSTGCYDWMNNIIYLDIEYWAQVNVATLYTEANAWVTGAMSLSRNQMTLLDGDMNGVYFYHGIYTEKTAMIDVDVDVAIDDNTFTVIWTEGPWPHSMWAISIYNDVESWSNDYVITDGPLATIDLDWSVTGNEITNEMTAGFRHGVDIFDYIYVDEGLSSLVYNLNWDVSSNTFTDLLESGIVYELSRDEETYGTVDLNIAVDIISNIITMCEDSSYDGEGIYVDTWYSTPLFVYWYDLIGNVTIDTTVTDNTITGAYDGLVIYGTIYDAAPADEETVYTYENNIVVKDNYISYCESAMFLEGDVALGNNALEECGGVDWYYANGELSGLTISGYYGIYLYEPLDVVIRDNQIEFMDFGIYVDDYYDEELTSVQILNNTLTGVDYYYGYGLELYDTCNVIASGNVITNAYYGVYMDYTYNVTLSDNQIESGYYGIYMYEMETVVIESNTITDGDGYGIYIDEYSWEVLIGNNTISWNDQDGLYVYYYDTGEIVLYNNVITDNGYGVDAECYEVSGLVWYVDAACQVSRNDVNFEGEVIVMSGGSMVLEDLCMDVYDGITVEEGGLLSMSDVDMYSWFLDVYGTLWATLSEFDETDVYIAPSATAEIRGSWFYYSGLLIDGCDATITNNRFDGYWSSENYAIAVRNGAAPTIVSNLITDYWYGIYTNGMDMGGIYDNLIVGNYIGLLTEDCTGTVHDNIFLGNDIALLLRNSDVSVEDNEIGYTDLFQVMANYATLLSLVSSTAEPGEVTDDLWDSLYAILAYADFDIYSLYDWVTDHSYGIWAESSTVQTSNNVYGMLSYALYAIDSEVHFSDDVRTTELVIPWVIEGEMFNYTANIYTLNGIFAARSDVYVDDCTIEVLDDALMFEASNAWVEGVTLMAGDFDYFLYGGSEVYNIDTTYETAKVEDSHSLNEGTWLTIYAVEKGEPAANVTIVIKNAKGEIVFNGTTDADGKVQVLLTQYAYTYEGKDDGFNPYTITAYFDSKEKSVDLTLNESYMEITIESKGSDMGAILAVIGVLVIILLIVAAVVVMRRRK